MKLIGCITQTAEAEFSNYSRIRFLNQNTFETDWTILCRTLDAEISTRLIGPAGLKFILTKLRFNHLVLSKVIQANRHASFPVMHIVGNIVIFDLAKFENKSRAVISHIYFISMYHDQFQFVLQLFQLVIISNLFPLETTQKCQYIDNFV